MEANNPSHLLNSITEIIEDYDMDQIKDEKDVASQRIDMVPGPQTNPSVVSGTKYK